jgi:hypothetical protein
MPRSVTMVSSSSGIRTLAAPLGNRRVGEVLDSQEVCRSKLERCPSRVIPLDGGTASVAHVADGVTADDGRSRKHSHRRHSDGHGQSLRKARTSTRDWLPRVIVTALMRRETQGGDVGGEYPEVFFLALPSAHLE